MALATLVSLTLGEDTSGSKSSYQNQSYETPEQRAAAAVDNILFARYILSTLAAVAFCLFIYRVVIQSIRYIRTLTCLNNDTQKYFKMPNLAFGAVKQHLLYAPLLRRRRNREIHFAWFHLGYIPTRFQSLFLAGIITLNVTLSVWGIEWDGTRDAALSHLRNRTGTLSVVNMIPLVILAGRNNPLIGLLNISFDNFNLVHRWFGRIFVLQALAHSIAHVMIIVDRGGWKSVQMAFHNSHMLMTGLVVSLDPQFAGDDPLTIRRLPLQPSPLHYSPVLHCDMPFMKLSYTYTLLSSSSPSPSSGNISKGHTLRATFLLSSSSGRWNASFGWPPLSTAM